MGKYTFGKAQEREKERKKRMLKLKKHIREDKIKEKRQCLEEDMAKKLQKNHLEND